MSNIYNIAISGEDFSMNMLSNSFDILQENIHEYLVEDYSKNYSITDTKTEEVFSSVKKITHEGLYKINVNHTVLDCDIHALG